jgi:hypothetical protein
MTMPPSWTLEFYDVDDGDALGSVTYDGQRMTAEGSMVQEMIEDHSPEEVLELYNGWSNGYVSARLAGDKRPLPQGGTRIHTQAEQGKAMKNLMETTTYQDPTTGEEYDPVDVPPDPTPGEEEDGGQAPTAPPGV